MVIKIIIGGFAQKSSSIYCFKVVPYFQTPEGIILPRDQVILKSGMHSGDYRLTEIVR